MKLPQHLSQYRISSDKQEIDVDAVHSYLTRSYWAEGIPLDTVRRSIEGSLCFSVLLGRQQIGFARLVTDKATFAYLADVYILPAHNGQGLAKQLIRAILQHKDLQGLRRILLATSDAHALYAKFGFTGLTEPQKFMQLWNPAVYTSGQP